MKRVKITAFILGIFLLPSMFIAPLKAQELTQTIRGQVLDADAHQPLPGANVVLQSSDPIIGTITDDQGYFILEGVSLGRHSLEVSFMGYGTILKDNIIVSSGNEVRIDIQMIESSEELGAVDVKARASKERPTDEMVLVSGRSITVEETKRFAGAIDDPARMVTSYAGVTNGSDGENDIIVRGNSPKGVLWRLEGVEIPNPNHFADEGFTSGPINALNSNMLGTSNFYTGAFAPRYGNALSGVMDMTLRNPNNKEGQYSASISVLGTDVTAEGPFSQNYDGAFLVNYRYSTLALISEIGFLDFDGIPEYQDASFKVNLPLGERHSLSLFGLGGTSHIEQLGYSNEEETDVSYSSFQTSRLGVIGVNHTWITGEKGYLKNTIAASGNSLNDEYQYLHDSDEDLDLVYQSDNSKSNLTLQSIYHHKFSRLSKLQTGVTVTRLNYKMHSDYWDDDTNGLIPTLQSDGSTYSGQAFASWMYRFQPRWQMVAGVHALYFDLNQSLSVEPRIAFDFQENENRRWSFGAGLHSRLESVSMYLAEEQLSDGTSIRPNDDLTPTKSAHFVFGVEQSINENTRIKAEIYYQYLFDVPVETDPSSNYSLLNSWGWFTTEDLVNDGTGRNYGLEVTVQRDFVNDYYLMGTASVFRSFQTPSTGVEMHTIFDSQFAFNALGGKEWKWGKAEKNRTLFVNTKVVLAGGQWYQPVLLNESIEQGEGVYDDYFTKKGAPVFKLDLAVGIRRSHAKWSSEFKIDIQNVLNSQAVTYEWYNEDAQAIEYGYQFPILPVLSYKVSW